MRNLSLIVVLLLGLLFAALPASAGNVKVDVCHGDGQDVYRLINISDAAFQSHVDHGDGEPGDPIGGELFFAEDCSFTTFCVVALANGTGGFFLIPADGFDREEKYFTGGGSSVLFFDSELDLWFMDTPRGTSPVLPLGDGQFDTTCVLP